MSKFFMFLIACGCSIVFAEESEAGADAQATGEVAFEDLFSESDIAALKKGEEEALFSGEEVLLDDVTQSELDAEELFE